MGGARITPLESSACARATAITSGTSINVLHATCRKECARYRKKGVC